MITIIHFFRNSVTFLAEDVVLICFHSYTATSNEKFVGSCGCKNENKVVFHISEDDSEIECRIYYK